jgi:hypothetical protein
VISVFLSHSSKDKPFVRELADELGRDGQIKVWLDDREIAPGQNIVTRIEEGLDADFVLLILSPDSVDSSWVEQEWTDAFWEQTNNRNTKLLGVLYRDCTIPRLIRNKKYFDLRTNHPEGFRKIRTFLLTEKPAPPERINKLPLRPPLFIGREPELADLRERLSEPGTLVHVVGTPGKGKTTLALEFAHRYQHDFEAVYWLPCQSESLASISADLTRKLGLKIEGDLPEIVRELKGRCAGRRCLIILDNVDDESPGELVPGGAASVLVTTRLSNLRFLRHRHPVPLPLFTDEDCFELFRHDIGVAEVDRHESDCRVLFKRLDHLPVAIAISAALIREDVRYTIAGLARNLPADVTSLLREAIAALDPSPRQLLSAMAACAPKGFYFDLAAEIAGLDEGAALEALQQLVARSLAEEMDRNARRYGLHALVREIAHDEGLGKTHAESIQQRFAAWETNWNRCEQQLPDFFAALEWALQSSASFGQQLAYNGYLLMRRVGRLAEAYQVCERMRRVSDDLQDRWWLQAWLCNQALILRAWGRLEEALTLLKQQEEICLELGNKNGLQASYGNQALILQAWGWLEEALELHKKEEAICLELCDRDGLRCSYCNQAAILYVWGRLEEALALHKQEEEICLDLGNKASLAHCYWYRGLLERARGNPNEEDAKLSAAAALFRELGMSRELQAAEADLATTRQTRRSTASQ